MTTEQLTHLRVQKSIGGGLYRCFYCEKRYAGARHGFRTSDHVTLQFCLTCWPEALKALEANTCLKAGTAEHY